MIKMSILDRAISYVNPQKGLERIRAKTALSFMESAGYVTAGSNRRSVKNWRTSNGSANQDTLTKVKKSRESSRDLSYNTPVARGGLLREVRNAIGPGLLLQSRLDTDVLKITPEYAEIWQNNVERRFHNWAKSTASDYCQVSNFYDLQWQVTYNTSLSGDVFAVLTTVKDNGRRKTAVKLIEADDVCNPISKPETTNFAGGIEVDPDTKVPSKIHVRKINPAAFINSDISFNFSTIEIPYKDENGRKVVLHIYHKERIGQSRGMPLFAAVVEMLKNISRLTESELMAAVIASFFTVFVKTSSPQSGMPSAAPMPVESGSSVAEQAAQAMEMGYGNVIELQQDNQSIEIADAKRPNGAFPPFMQAMIDQIGAAIEIPSEVLMLKFASSYTAFRGAIQEAWKFFKGSRFFNVTKFCEPVYENWLETEILEGRIAAPGFFEDEDIRAAWCSSYWVGPGQGQVDPIKETVGAELRIKNFLSNYEDEYASINGADWDGCVKRARQERKKVKSVIDDTFNVDSSKSKSHIDEDLAKNKDSDDDSEVTK